MVKTAGLIINHYPSQAYQTIFNQKTGFLIRSDDKSGKDPFWCSYGPELIDISITNWCDKDCSFCYKHSSHDKNHLSLEAYKNILRQAAQMKVLQVALGGGNPNQHPGFCEMLRLTRDEYNIVPSYTTNGRGISEEILSATKKYCGAVAVSIYEPYNESFLAVQKLLSYGIRTNIDFLITTKSVSIAIEWLKNLPDTLKGINAIIFLNYKPVGRNPSKELLAKNSEAIGRLFQIAGVQHDFKIGFDSCSVSGIARFTKTSPKFIERCEASRFSMYISEDNKMYPCSFMIDKFEGIPVTNNNIQSVWKHHELFIKTREQLSTISCQGCAAKSICSGGCPIYPDINICP